MSVMYRERFRIRIHECDAWGHLNHVHYFHLMQQAALSACAALGWGRERFVSEGMVWVVRRTEITYRREIPFDADIILETCVTAIERSSCLREYRFVAADGSLYAEASSEWVLLDRESGRPRRIDPLLEAVFLGEAASGEWCRSRIELGLPPEGAWRVRHRVGFRDLDMDWRVNNAVYVAWTEDCGLGILDGYGWPFARMVGQDFAIVARRYEIDYRAPAQPGDEVETATWVSSVRGVSAERNYLVIRAGDGAILAQAKALWAWVSLSTGRPVPIPAEFYADFVKNFAPGVDDGRLLRSRG